MQTARQKHHVIYKGTPIRLKADFLADLRAKREWNEICKVLKEKKIAKKFPAKLSSSNEGEKDFP